MFHHKVIKYCFLAIVGILISTQSIAATKDEIAKCAAISGDAQRLMCYDELAKKLGVDKPKTDLIAGKGKWIILTEKSPIDDSVNVYLSIKSEEAVCSGYNTVRPTLSIRCAENKTNVFINWGLYLGLDSTYMLTRFDKEKAATEKWSISTDNKAVFVYGDDITFAKKMMKHSKLLVQIMPYGESPVMATFDIRGLPEAIQTLRKECNW